MEPKTSSASCLNVNRGFVLVATGALHFASASMMSLATKEYMHLYFPRVCLVPKDCSFTDLAS